MLALRSRAVMQRSVAMALGVLLLGASLLKAWSETRSPQPLDHSWIDSPLVSEWIAAFEATVGVILIAGSWPRPTWYVAVLVFSFFAMVTAVETARGRSSCGCFGAVQVRPVYTMSVDLFAVAMLLLTGRPSESANAGSSNRNGKWMFASGLGLCWLVTVFLFWQTRPAIAMAAGPDFGKAGSLVVLEPEKWSGQRFALAEHIDIGSQLASGQWIVLLVHHDCDHCAAAVPRYVSASTAEGSKVRLAVIEMPPFDDGSNPPPWQLPSSVLSGRLNQTRDWFASTPVAILIEDGKVLAATEGDAASIPNLTWWKH